MPSAWKHLAAIGYYYRRNESGISLGSFRLRSPGRLLCSEFLLYSVQASISGSLFMLTPAFHEYTPNSFQDFARMSVGGEVRVAEWKPDREPEPNSFIEHSRDKEVRLKNPPFLEKYTSLFLLAAFLFFYPHPLLNVKRKKILWLLI